MSSRKTREIEKALISKGFRPDYGSHISLWLCVKDKRTTVRTVLSHGIREYGESLLAKLKKQLGLSTKAQLLDLIDCPMSEEQYIEYLIEIRRIEL